MVVERGTIVICILSIFSIFVQDVHVPYYIHAAGSQASMIIGKTLALISLRGVVSSQRLHGVVIDTTLLATGSSYGKVPALTSRGAIISSRMNGVLLKAPPSSSEFESNGQLYLDYLLRVSCGRVESVPNYRKNPRSHQPEQHTWFYLRQHQRGMPYSMSAVQFYLRQHQRGMPFSMSYRFHSFNISIWIICSARHQSTQLI